MNPASAARDLAAGDHAVDDAVRDGVGAQTNGAVHAASGLACGIKPRNDLARDGNGFGLGRRQDAAHAVMDLGREARDEPGPFGLRLEVCVDAAPERILLRGDGLVEGGDGGLERVERNLVRCGHGVERFVAHADLSFENAVHPARTDHVEEHPALVVSDGEALILSSSR